MKYLLVFLMIFSSFNISSMQGVKRALSRIYKRGFKSSVFKKVFYQSAKKIFENDKETLSVFEKTKPLQNIHLFNLMYNRLGYKEKIDFLKNFGEPLVNTSQVRSCLSQTVSNNDFWEDLGEFHKLKFNRK